MPAFRRARAVTGPAMPPPMIAARLIIGSPHGCRADRHGRSPGILKMPPSDGVMLAMAWFEAWSRRFCCSRSAGTVLSGLLAVLFDAAVGQLLQLRRPLPGLVVPAPVVPARKGPAADLLDQRAHPRGLGGEHGQVVLELDQEQPRDPLLVQLEGLPGVGGLAFDRGETLLQQRH